MLIPILIRILKLNVQCFKTLRRNILLINEIISLLMRHLFILEETYFLINRFFYHTKN